MECDGRPCIRALDAAGAAHQPGACVKDFAPAAKGAGGCPAADPLNAQYLWAALQPPNTHTLTPGGTKCPHSLTKATSSAARLAGAEAAVLWLCLSASKRGAQVPYFWPQDRPASSLLGKADLVALPRPPQASCGPETPWCASQASTQPPAGVRASQTLRLARATAYFRVPGERPC